MRKQGSFSKNKQISLLKATCQDKQDSRPRRQTPKLILSISKGCIWPMADCHPLPFEPMSHCPKKKKNRLDYHSIFISLNIHFKWIDGVSKCPSFRLYLIIPFPQSQSLHRQEADMAGSTMKSSERKPGREEARPYILWAHRRPPLRKEFFLPMRFSFPQVILEFLFTNS